MRHHRTKTGETVLAYIVLAILSFLCLFFFQYHLISLRMPSRKPEITTSIARR